MQEARVCLIISAALNPGGKSHRGVSLKTTNSSCVASRCQLCRESFPVGYYQSTWQSEMLWWNIRTGCFSGSLQMAQPEAWNRNHRPRGSPMLFSKSGQNFPLMFTCSTLQDPQGSRGRALTDTRQDGADSQSKAWPWFPGVCIVPLLGCLTLSKYLGADPLFLSKQQQFRCRFFEQAPGSSLRRPLWVWVGPQASGSSVQTADGSGIFLLKLTDRGSRLLENG